MHVWKPPSFDAPLPPLPEPLDFVSPIDGEPAAATPVAQPVPSISVQELQAVRAKAHQEGFLRGLQEGLEEGRVQGEALGRDEGFKAGLQEGREQGLAQGAEEGRERVVALAQALQQSIDSLVQLPMALERPLTEWVYQTACRLSGQSAMAREHFVHAVQEALMRLPRPGETLFLRIPVQDLALWQSLVSEVPAGMAVTLVEDPHLDSGHAHLEVAGARVDLGAAARDALVRSALGLLPVATETRD